jgi:adenylosuccinate lyase
MSYFFSPQYKFTSWRRLWVALAIAQKKLGLNITDKQIAELKKNVENIDFNKAEAYEKKFHHDVMAHIHAYGDQCFDAKGIIHLGSTSCYVTDNGELIQMREGLNLLNEKLLLLISHLSAFAKKYASIPTLAYTHFQPAQPTTVGKRASLWLQDFLFDVKDLDALLKNFPFLGLKGATGNQSSFLELFDGKEKKVEELEKLVAKEMGFEQVFPITGQTYPRKQDLRILNVLTGIAVSAHKCCTDLRLLAHLREIQEPHETSQIGSSAMPYKKNPILCERVCGLARFLISLSENTAYTAALQWLERTLDDSSNRRLSLSEAFLTADSILNLLLHIFSKLTIFPTVIQNHLQEALPLIATEHILMIAVKKGKDRQKVHERLRLHAEGDPQDLLNTIANDPAIGLSKKELEEIVKSETFTGRAASQVHAFIEQEVAPLLKNSS